MAKRIIKKATDTTKKKVRKYGNQFKKEWTDEAIEQLADEMYDWFQDKNNFWISDFAINQMVNRQRFSEFANKNEYFNFIYEQVKLIQESKLVKMGLSKTISSAMPIFALKNVAGWKDSVEVDNKDMNITVKLPKEFDN